MAQVGAEQYPSTYRDQEDKPRIGRRGFVIGGVATALSAGVGAGIFVGRNMGNPDTRNDLIAYSETEPTTETALGAYNSVDLTAAQEQYAEDAEVLGLEQGGDVAMTNFALERGPDIYKEGETTPEMYLEAYNKPGSTQNIEKMFEISDELLKLSEGRQGSRPAYVRAVMDILRDATKPGRTEQELMEHFNPEHFVDKTGMDSEQRAALESKIDIATSNYVNAKVDKYTDAICEATAMPTARGANKHQYGMLAELRGVALRKSAEHAIEHGNTSWDMDFSASNIKEDLRGETLFITADLAIKTKAWSSSGEIVTNTTEKAKVFFTGESERGNMVRTKFNADYKDEEKQSFTEALKQLSLA